MGLDLLGVRWDSELGREVCLHGVWGEGDVVLGVRWGSSCLCLSIWRFLCSMV